MRQIIYSSSSADEMTPKALGKIAAQAKKNNPRDNITGVLLYGDNMFFQVLEGPDEFIDDMKNRIWSDARHTGIAEFKNCEITERSFPDWSMGCYRVDEMDDDGVWTILDVDSITNHLPPSASPDVAIHARTFFASIASRNLE